MNLSKQKMSKFPQNRLEMNDILREKHQELLFKQEIPMPAIRKKITTYFQITIFKLLELKSKECTTCRLVMIYTTIRPRNKKENLSHGPIRLLIFKGSSH